MARDFNGTDNGLTRTGTPSVTDYPFTVLMRINWSTLDATGDIVWAMRNNAASTGFDLRKQAGSTAIRFNHFNGTADDFAESTSTVSTGVWYSIGGLAVSSTDRRVVFNGVAEDTTTTSRTAPTLDITTIAKTNSAAAWADANIAEVAMWSAILDADELLAYHAGYSPLLIRPTSLASYWPLIGRYSPEIDLVSGHDLSLVATPGVAAHPRVIYPALTGTVGFSPRDACDFIINGPLVDATSFGAFGDPV